VADIIVHVFGRTDVGRSREHNEDAFVVADLSTGTATLQPEVRTHVLGPRGTLFMVADGMGGAAAGEVASAMAVETVLDQIGVDWRGADRADAETFALALRRAAQVANQRIHQHAQAHPENRGMGSTATIAGLLGDTLFVAHVGDSRAYLVRDGVARQISKDQSLLQRLIDIGELTEDEAEDSDRRNIILQALGPEASVKVDLTHQRVRRGDTLVICSDGLTSALRKASTDAIARVVSEERDLVAACRRLIDQANEAGGPDNITVIVARFEGDGLAAPGPGDAVGHVPFVAESEARATMPMTAVTDEMLSEPTVEMPPLAGAGAAPVATPTAAPAPRPAPRGSDWDLRLLFGVIAAAGLAIWAFLRFRG
jgi:protein phosphatase